MAGGTRRGFSVMTWVGAGVAAAVLPLSLVALPPAAGASNSKGGSVKIGTAVIPSLGVVLTTSSGLTLYHFTADPKGKATCTGACAKVWPQLFVPKGDKVKGPKGLKGLSTIAAGHGHRQVSFDGVALYTFAGDKKKGQIHGQGVEGDWFAVLKSGVTPQAKSGAASTIAPTTTTAPPTTTTTPKSTPATVPKSVPTPTAPPAPTPTTQPAPPPTTTPTTQPAPPPTTTPTTAPSGGYGY